MDGFEKFTKKAIVEPEFSEYIAKAVAQARNAESAAIEEAVEKSLQGGEHGVFVLRDSPGGSLLSAEVNKFVPYGYIYVGVSPLDGPVESS